MTLPTLVALDVPTLKSIAAEQLSQRYDRFVSVAQPKIAGDQIMTVSDILPLLAADERYLSDSGTPNEICWFGFRTPDNKVWLGSMTARDVLWHLHETGVLPFGMNRPNSVHWIHPLPAILNRSASPVYPADFFEAVFQRWTGSLMPIDAYANAPEALARRIARDAEILATALPEGQIPAIRPKL